MNPHEPPLDPLLYLKEEEKNILIKYMATLWNILNRQFIKKHMLVSEVLTSLQLDSSKRS